MKKELLSLLAIPVIGLTFASCSSPYQQIKIQSTPTGIERYLEKPLIQSTNKGKPVEEFRRAPQYTRYKKPGEWCAGYAVLTSRDAFNKNMFYGDFRELRDRNKIVAQVNGNNRLRQLAKNGTLKPGMIVGFYNPHSLHNDEIDEEAGYTHAGTFAGERSDDKLIFYHHYANRMEKKSLGSLESDYDLSARVILDEKTSKIGKAPKIKNYYTVKKDDTLWDISKKHNLSVQQLKKYNSLTSNTIYIKQRLKLR